MIGVLHTWTRDLNYHPHVHYLVPAGGLSLDDKQWLSSRDGFLVPAKALSILFRAKFRDALRQTDLFQQVPPEVWHQDWVVDCQPVVDGATALKYAVRQSPTVPSTAESILCVAGHAATPLSDVWSDYVAEVHPQTEKPLSA